MEDHHVIQWIGNGLSVGAIISTVLGWLPAAGAIVAIVWYLIQIKESETFKRWVTGRHQRRIAKLEAKLAVLKSTQPHSLAPDVVP